MGTHAFDMIMRLKENENLRKKKYFKNKYRYTHNLKANNVEFKTATQEQKDAIRKIVKKERTKERKQSLLILSFSLILTIAIALLFFRFLRFQ